MNPLILNMNRATKCRSDGCLSHAARPNQSNLLWRPNMAKFSIPPTRERLKELLDYNPETGVFTWVNAGKIAGSPCGFGYRAIRCLGGRYYSHRLAWFYVRGAWPKNQIDHINGNKSDNRIANLREATHKENLWNSAKHKDNKSGLKGVSLHAQSGRWQTQIYINGRSRFLGLHDSPAAAHKAYCDAANQLHGKFARVE